MDELDKGRRSDCSANAKCRRRCRKVKTIGRLRRADVYVRQVQQSGIKAKVKAMIENKGMKSGSTGGVLFAPGIRTKGVETVAASLIDELLKANQETKGRKYERIRGSKRHIALRVRLYR